MPSPLFGAAGANGGETHQGQVVTVVASSRAGPLLARFSPWPTRSTSQALGSIVGDVVPRTRARFLAFALFVAATGVAREDKTTSSSGHVPRQRSPVCRSRRQGRQVVKAEGYGLAPSGEHAAKPETVYKIGSVSNQSSPPGSCCSCRTERFALTTRSSRDLEGTPQHWTDVTIRRQLTHTSGLIREAPGFHPINVQTHADFIGTAYLCLYASRPARVGALQRRLLPPRRDHPQDPGRPVEQKLWMKRSSSRRASTRRERRGAQKSCPVGPSATPATVRWRTPTSAGRA